MTSPRSAVGVLAVLSLLTGLLAACSGVPRSSRPDPIRTIGGASASSSPGTGPTPGDEPRGIVNGFLRASLDSAARHSKARQFLTADAGSHWKDGTVTVVDDDYRVGVADVHAGSATVTITASHVGSINSDGIYTPEKRGQGSSIMAPLTYQLSQVDGQWRIADLPAGVVISKTDLQEDYNARTLYFFDSTESRLVPDVRYSGLADQELATWMLGEVLAGPRPELGQAVQNEMPDQVDARSVSVTNGDPIKVEIPTTSQLNATALTRLAIQLAYTFGPLRFSARLTLTDGGKPVSVPTVGTVFSSLDFPGFGPDQDLSGSQAYYLRGGGVVDALDEKPLPGPVGTGAYGLMSLAIARTGTGQLMVAGVTADNSLMMGTSTGLTRVSLPAGQLSPPEWQPNSDELWIAVGESLYSIALDDKNHVPHQVPVPASLGGLPKGQITGLKFSRDGVQLAVIVETSDQSTRAVFYGSVARSGRNVAIEDFEPITPTALQVSDVAWQDSTSLLLVAGLTGGEAGIWKVQSDGSDLGTVPTSGLPRGLTSIAATVGQQPLVSTSGQGNIAQNSAVWEQDGGGWSSLVGSGATTTGYAPAYAP